MDRSEDMDVIELSEEQLSLLAKKKLGWCVAGMPYLSSTTDLKRSIEILAPTYEKEFCWSACFDPEFLASLMYRGYLTMAMKDNGVEILTPKLHLERSIVPFKQVHKPHKSTIKKSKKFEFSADSHCADVIAGIVKHHGENWFYPRLRKTFIAMNAAAEKGWYGGRVRLHSFELWLDGELVAGECGYSCGKVYTSLSGYTNVDGAGTIQMFAMVSHLKAMGFELWDLGMQLAYKGDTFGAIPVLRLKFLETLDTYRDLATKSVILSERVNAKSLIQKNLNVNEVD